MQNQTHVQVGALLELDSKQHLSRPPQKKKNNFVENALFMNSGDWGKSVQFFRKFLFVLCEASGENAVAVSSLSPWLLMGSRVLVGLRSGKEGGEVKGDHWKKKRKIELIVGKRRYLSWLVARKMKNLALECLVSRAGVRLVCFLNDLILSLV